MVTATAIINMQYIYFLDFSELNNFAWDGSDGGNAGDKDYAYAEVRSNGDWVLKMEKDTITMDGVACEITEEDALGTDGDD